MILTNIGQIRALTPAQFQEKTPVQLEAVVTLCVPTSGYLWVQDDNGGLQLISRDKEFAIVPGDRVRVAGRVGVLNNLAVVQVDGMVVLEKGTVPSPLTRTAEQLNTFADQNQRVETEGHVLAVTELPSFRNSSRWHLELESGDSRFSLELPKRTNDNINIHALKGATIRACGVCVLRVLGWGEKLQPELLMQDASDLVVLSRGQTEVAVASAQTPVQSIASAMRDQSTNKNGALAGTQGAALNQRHEPHIVSRDDVESVFAETPAVTPLPNKPAQLPLLTTAREIRELPPEHAAWQYPVHLRGVVTLYSPQRWKFYLQDDTAGIYVQVWRASPALKIGDVIDITGVSAPGGFLPIVVTTNISIVGTAPLPEARPATLFQLATGQYDGQWVEVRGVVHSATYEYGLLQLKLNDPDGPFMVNILTTNPPANLVDAAVRIRGVPGSEFNSRRQITGFTIWSPSLNQLKIEAPGVADPLSLPTKPIISLSQFSPLRSPQHRVKISGAVTLRLGEHAFFVQDGSDAIEVFAAEADDVKPGDRVMVAGYPSLGDYNTVLRDATCKIIKHDSLPEPKSLPPGSPLVPQLHGTWVRIEGRLLNHNQVGREQILTLQHGGSAFEARCLAPGENQKPLVDGSLLNLTGVYRVLANEMRSPSAFQLLVPSSKNIQVVEQPSWWTPRRLLIIVAILAIAFGATNLWVFSLRHRVREQTRVIRERLEKEATLEQRHREIFEGASDIIYTHDLDGKFTSINPSGLRVLGYTAAELERMHIDDLAAPECRELVQQMRQPKAATNESSAHELEFIARNGQRVIVEASTRFTYKDSQPSGVHGIARDITERKRAELALAQASRLLDVLLENSPDYIYFKDRQSRFVRCSKAMAVTFHQPSVDALIAKTDFDFFSEHARDAYEDEQKIMRTGEPLIGKLEKEQHKDGRITWALTTKLPWRDEAGNIIGTFGISKDITAIKEAEAKLDYERELLRTLLDNLPVAIYFKDRESRFVRLSKAMAEKARSHVADNRCLSNGNPNGSNGHNSPHEYSEVNGLVAEDFAKGLIGKSDFDLFTEEHARAAYEDEQSVISLGKPIVDKLERETHPDGKFTWCLTTKGPWRDKSGDIVGTFGISKDVTAIKEAEAKLAYERELFQSLLDHLPDCIYFKDTESRFVRVSKSKAETTLQTARDLYLAKHPAEASNGLPAHLNSVEEFAKFLIGKTDLDTFDDEFARAAIEEEQAIIRTGEPLIGKLERVAKADGSAIWMLVTKMPWHNKDGNIIGTFGVSRDITALKVAEDELATAHHRLLETSRLAGMAEVATDVLHNVGNVLNSVNVSSSLVIDRVRESKLASLPKLARLLEKNNARLGEFIVNDPQGKQIPGYLTALAECFAEDQTVMLKELDDLRKNIDHIKQIVAMQQSYAKVAGVVEQVTAEQLVEDALHINTAALTRHRVRVQRAFQEGPPLLTERHKVLQILVNLIRNAKYALHESTQPDKVMTIKIENEDDKHVKIQVIDNGVGIPEENLSRIFSHGFTTRRNGHGFGLHSSALAVRELGGTLQGQSEGPDKGATFTLRLPCQPPTNSGGI